MYIQITNKSLVKHNITMVEVSDLKQMVSTVNNKIRLMGWNQDDCIKTQVSDLIMTAKYRGVDGKSIAPGKKQYKSRAKASGTLNKFIGYKS